MITNKPNYKDKGNYEKYSKKMHKYCEDNHINLTEKEKACYINLILVMNEFSNYKCLFEDLIALYDVMSDVLNGTRPDIAILGTNDKFIGLYRLICGWDTNNILNDIERERITYAIYHAALIKKYDENKKEVTWSLEDFVDSRIILNEFENAKESEPEKFIVKYEKEKTEPSTLGKTMENPIEFTHISKFEEYLDNLMLVDGTPITYERIGSVENSKNVYIDVYEIKAKNKVIDELYFSGYGFYDTKEIPKGYKNRIRIVPPRNWGKGIPTYTANDLMTVDELLDFSIQILRDIVIKDGYDIISFNNRTDLYPHMILEKDDEIYGVMIECDIAPNIPKLSEEIRIKMKRFSERTEAKPLYASVSIGATEPERFEAGLALLGDGFYSRFTGFEEIK